MLPARLPRSRLSRGVGSGAWVPAWPALDAVSAARAAQSGRACGASKGRDGAVEAIRALMVAKRSAAGDRTQTNGQARALVLTGPDDLRARFTGHTAAALVAELASLRPRPGSTVGYATRIALRELGRRAEFPGGQLERLDELIGPLVAARAPGLLAVFGIGAHTAALLLIAAGDHSERLRSEAAWAHLCGAAPIPASSGKTVRRRLNPGGDRQANHALWRIVFTRLGSDPATRAYAERRTAEWKSKPQGSTAGSLTTGTPSAASRACSPRTSRTWIQIITEDPADRVPGDPELSLAGKNTSPGSSGRAELPANRQAQQVTVEAAAAVQVAGGAAGSGCSERPRHHSSITLSDTGGLARTAHSRRSGRPPASQRGQPRRA